MGKRHGYPGYRFYKTTERKAPKRHIPWGTKLVSSLLNLDLIDEWRLTECPTLAANGEAPFKNLNERHSMELVSFERIKAGGIRLIYTLK